MLFRSQQDSALGERWVLLGPGFRLPSRRGRCRGALDRSHPLPSPGSHASSCIWGQGGCALVKSKGGRPRRERQKVPANLGCPGVPGLGDASCNPTRNTNIPPATGQGLPVPPRGQGLGHRGRARLGAEGGRRRTTGTTGRQPGARNPPSHEGGSFSGGWEPFHLPRAGV